MLELTTLAYEEHCDERGSGALIIRGIPDIPYDRYFDPLAKIWSTLRRRFWEQYRIDAVACFTYDSGEKLAFCNLYLNYSCIERLQISESHYNRRFQDVFPYLMIQFEETLEAFLTDPENGYEEYLRLFNDSSSSHDDYRETINKFLASIGKRTQKDEKRSAKKAKRAKKTEQTKLPPKNPS
ncbi:hypothetical protein IJJ05_01570 [Candidatus Saccharibacteria bacterium]|nr:hypothetical protein [Candidatus Saccharibacteria bacterium]